MSGPDLDMRKLRYFVAVAEELNFGRAARRLHIAQPVLSRQIRAFEDELGVRLLIRDTRGTTLTDAGSQLLQDARFLLSESKALQDRLTRAASSTRVVRVGVMPGLLATAAVRSFAAANPAHRAEVVPIGWAAQLESVRNRTLDVVYAREPIDHRGLGAAALLEEPRDALLPADDPLARRRSVRLSELASYRPLQDPALIPEWCALAMPEHRRAAHRIASTMEEKLERVAAHEGFAILPRSATAFYRRPDVCVVPIEDLAPAGVTLIWDAAVADPVRDAFVTAALACAGETV
ncbi:LysR family transcriptional regulator [Mycolicibacterium rhodesiae]|uniref:Probable hydrogen peroxide-inducible genes activator n=1 Tax=Mycolicibacterium rhodesiae TaxID=36814 RepID=A0A1X0IR29_MYCRH|nr:LysR family transcriptional regulator [Mycolicibacterium rhodesiae]MCV7347022.1 LysR family transcriptional regulator [Mycolicibacterium rhodesiae]ORB50833.1 LysR family transcriptional regulator [Mycolicibacterium rhodesiae]